MAIPVKSQAQPPAQTIEDVLMRGDLSKLNDEQRLEYCNSICKMVGLNPLTKPFDYLFLNGKLTLYPNKSCAEQLRKIHNISLEIVSQDLNADGLYTVHARAKDGTGRTDEDIGVVTFGQLRGGDAVANMILKCVTKAKRRVTLSICGLGFLDSEGDDAPRTEKRQPYRLYPAEDKTPDETSDDDTGELITQKQIEELIKDADALGLDKRKMLDTFGKRWNMEISAMAAIPAEYFTDAKARIRHWQDEIDKAEKEAQRT